MLGHYESSSSEALGFCHFRKPLEPSPLRPKACPESQREGTVGQATDMIG